MTVSIHLTKRIYTANGITREWALDFPFLSIENLRIYITSPAGQETRVQSNYALNDEGTALIYPTVASELTPLASGWKITILRQTPITQGINLLRQGELDAEVVEQGYDKLTLITQELAEEIDRCIKYPVSTQPQSLDSDTFLDAILSAKQSALTSAQTAQASAALASQTAQTAAASLSTQAQTLSNGLTQTVSTVEQAKQTAVSAAEQAQISAQTAQTTLSSKADVTALNSLANMDLSNITNAGKQVIVNNAMPDYANGITVSSVGMGVYTQVTKDSFVVTYGMDYYTEDYYIYISPDNGTTTYIVGRRYDDQNSQTEAVSFTFFVPKGWYFTNNAEGGYSAHIYPLKGAQ